MGQSFGRASGTTVEELKNHTNNLKNEIEAAKKLVDEKGTQEDKDKLREQLLRLQKLGNKLNSTEGIVFTWKDRMMKMTGSFAAANAIIGAKYRIK